ncbi:hypothetical protein [Alkalitalea saponilacus]|uniref:hypothetical protein n=1 Tax=Alkalitalea saponilacus TaxID=889453 RepID=UPI00117861A3|nr:hypothetical protein [Alkalitalea saponilacus]
MKNRRPENGNRRSETGKWRPENGDRRSETGDRKPETGKWRPETGDRKMGLWFGVYGLGFIV